MSPSAAPPLLRFDVGMLRAALPLGLVREIVENPDIVRVPGAHPQVRGVFLKQGVAVPVYDLGRFAPLWSGGGPPQAAAPGPQGPRHLIVCDWGDLMIALLGEGVDLLEGTRPSPGENETAPTGIREEFIGSMIRRGSEAIAVLDPARLFASLGVPAAPGGDAEEEDGENDPARG